MRLWLGWGDFLISISSCSYHTACLPPQVDYSVLGTAGLYVLDDFFKLNGKFEKFTAEKDLDSHFKTSSQLENVLYEPSKWPTPPYKVNGKKFLNVSLSKTSFSKVSFQNCHFEDCLLIGCNFQEVEFHRCTFKNCNFYKSEFYKCYLDPSVITFHKHYKKNYANVGVGLFQQLLDNSADQHQADHSMLADIAFRQWQRAQLRHDLAVGKITCLGYLLLFVRNFSFDWIAGYGYRPARFFGWTILLFLMISLINFWLLADSLTVNESGASGAGLVDAIYYTFSVLTVLGFSTVVPVSSTAKLVTVIQALAAIGWLGIFTSVLVKRFIR